MDACYLFLKIADCILIGLKKDGSGNNNNDTGQDDEVFRCKAEDGQKKLINQECSEMIAIFSLMN